MSTIYVVGHRNPDADAIASAIGYAELKARLDPTNEYVPVRLGPATPQTKWLLERSDAPEPELLPHVMLRVCDVMRTTVQLIGQNQPIREAVLAMSSAGQDLLPVVDEHEGLVGIVTDRTLVRRFLPESRRTSTLEDTPTRVRAIVDVLEGELVAGEDKMLAGRIWAQSMHVESPTRISAGDVVVVGDREDAQRLAIEQGAALVVLSNGVRPGDAVLTLAQERGTSIVVSPLDTHVSAREISLAAPCGAVMEGDPLTTTPLDLLSSVSEQVKEVQYGAAVAVDERRSPLGLLVRSDLVAPAPRRVILVDHAEQEQSVVGIEQAEIVEILDHHHIGSIETRLPVRATFDPVGCTSTLVIERFRRNGMEPRQATGLMLLGAVLSDTVMLNSPTTTGRDRAVVEYLERVLATDATAFGREMFQRTSDVSQVSADDIVSRDAKRYLIGGGEAICIAQVEVIGDALLDRKQELLEALQTAREREGLRLNALMVTDVLSNGTDLLVAGDAGAVARALGAEAHDSEIALPGVMSRKKQVAPKLLALL